MVNSLVKISIIIYRSKFETKIANFRKQMFAFKTSKTGSIYLCKVVSINWKKYIFMDFKFSIVLFFLWWNSTEHQTKWSVSWIKWHFSFWTIYFLQFKILLIWIKILWGNQNYNSEFHLAVLLFIIVLSLNQNNFLISAGILFFLAKLENN